MLKPERIFRGKVVTFFNEVLCLLPNAALTSTTPAWKTRALEDDWRSGSGNAAYRNMMERQSNPAYEARDCSLLWANKAFYEFTGVDVRGLGWEKITHPADLDSGVIEKYSAACSERRRYLGRIRLLSRDGTYRTMLSVATPSGGDCMIGVYLDITSFGGRGPMLTVVNGGRAAKKAALRPFVVKHPADGVS